MNVVSNKANFSLLNLGKVITEVDSDVAALLQGYSNLDFSFQTKFQKFIDDIGGLSGNIWSSISLLLVPYLAATIDEAYFNVKTGSIKNPGSSAHKSACSPTRGTGATYDKSGKSNALNFTSILTNNSCNYIGACQFIADYDDSNSVLIYTRATGAIAANAENDYFSAATMMLNENQVYMGFDKTVPIIGNHATLVGVANDATVSEESICLMIDGAKAKVDELPSADKSGIPLCNATTFNYSASGIEYSDNVYQMFIAGTALSKEDLELLHVAMYNFCKYI